MLPFLSKLESLAGSAVRAAGKVDADLIVVYTATGGTEGLHGATSVVHKQHADFMQRWKSCCMACMLWRPAHSKAPLLVVLKTGLRYMHGSQCLTTGNERN